MPFNSPEKIITLRLLIRCGSIVRNFSLIKLMQNGFICFPAKESQLKNNTRLVLGNVHIITAGFVWRLYPAYLHTFLSKYGVIISERSAVHFRTTMQISPPSRR